MKSFLLSLIFLLAGIMTIHAQRLCGALGYRQQLLAADPSLNNTFNNIERQIAAFKKPNGGFAMRDTTPDEIIHVPVVIHILYQTAEENISIAQVKLQIDALNADFRMQNSDRVNTPDAFKSLAGDARIQFCLAQVDPTGKPTTGIERKYTSQSSFTTDDVMKMPLKGGMAAWDSKRYLNIWVCKLGGASVGYATPPGAAADLDGVVIAYDVFGTTGTLRPVFNKGRTTTHEVGHWLGLIHLWGDTGCGDDHVDDTPAQQSYNYGCQTFPKLSTCSPNANGDMFMNFMDFSNDACMNLFTKGQVKRMRALFATNGFRNSFLASFACDSTLAQGGALPATDTVKVETAVALSARVYPSPVNAVATIECKAATARTMQVMNIFNSVGMKVYTAQLSQEKTLVNLSKLSPGVYFIRIGSAKGECVTRFIKQ